jgi:single-stranded DNA-binding protein
MTIHCGFTCVLTADAKPRKSAGGRDWVSLNVRVGSGETTQWCSVAVFGNEAIDAAALKENAAIYIEGRLELRKWKNHAGHDMAGLNVTANFWRPVNLRAKPKETSARAIAAASPFAPPEFDDRLDDIGSRSP